MSKLEENSALATARAKGEEEGMKLGKEEITKKLLDLGWKIEKIIEITGLTKEEIKEIANKHKRKERC